jgi:competence protein ComEC
VYAVVTFFPHLPIFVGALLFALMWFALWLGRFLFIRRLFDAAAFLFFLFLGTILMVDDIHRTDFPFPVSSQNYSVLLTDYPQLKEKSVCFRAETAHHSLLLYFPRDTAALQLQRGDRLLVTMRPSQPLSMRSDSTNFNYVDYLHRMGISGTAYVGAGHWQVTSHESRRTVQQFATDVRNRLEAVYHRSHFTADNEAVLSALTLGDRHDLTKEVRNTFASTGVSHILAISGLHVGILFALFIFLFPIERRYSLPRRGVGVVVLLCLLWGFAFLTGLSVSVVRAVMMLSLWVISYLQLEEAVRVNLFAAALFFMLLIHPTWLLDVSFQLSVAAVTSLFVLYPLIYEQWHPRFRWVSYLWGIVSASVAAQLGTAPLVAYYFGRLPVHFLLSNCWMIPLTTLLLCGALLLLLFAALPWVSTLLAAALDGLLTLQHHWLTAIGHLPYAEWKFPHLLWIDVVIGYLLVALLAVLLHHCKNIKYSPSA